MMMERTINATSAAIAASTLVTFLLPPAGVAAVIGSTLWRFGVPALLSSALALDAKDQVQLALLRRKVAKMEEALREKGVEVPETSAEEEAGEP